MGLGGRGAYNLFAGLLRHWGERAVNLAGTLGPGTTTVILQSCGGFAEGRFFPRQGLRRDPVP